MLSSLTHPPPLSWSYISPTISASVCWCVFLIDLPAVVFLLHIETKPWLQNIIPWHRFTLSINFHLQCVNCLTEVQRTRRSHSVSLSLSPSPTPLLNSSHILPDRKFTSWCKAMKFQDQIDKSMICINLKEWILNKNCLKMWWTNQNVCMSVVQPFVLSGLKPNCCECHAAWSRPASLVECKQPDSGQTRTNC